MGLMFANRPAANEMVRFRLEAPGIALGLIQYHGREDARKIAHAVMHFARKGEWERDSFIVAICIAEDILRAYGREKALVLAELMDVMVVNSYGKRG